MGDIKNMCEQERIEYFTKKLLALSYETGVVVNVIGGVYVYDPDTINQLHYENDIAMGDLTAEVILRLKNKKKD